MKYCDKCKVNIRDNRKYCPLCQDLLIKKNNTKNTKTFPEVKTLYQQHNLFFRILIFASVFISISTLIINLVFPSKGWWSIFVLIGVLCMWLCVYVTVNKKSNLTKTIIYQAVIISLLALFWDWFTKWRGWSIDFVIPITLSVSMISMSIIAKVLKLKTNDYIINLWSGAIFGLIPLFLIISNKLHTAIPSLICIIISIFFLLVIIVFQGKNIHTELKRKFHI